MRAIVSWLGLVDGTCKPRSPRLFRKYWAAVAQKRSGGLPRQSLVLCQNLALVEYKVSAVCAVHGRGQPAVIIPTMRSVYHEFSTLHHPDNPKRVPCEQVW